MSCKYATCNNLTTVNIPKSLTSIGDNPFVDSAVRQITCESTLFEVDDNALYTRGKNKIIALFNKETRHFTIPDSTNCIGNWAFWGCKSLYSVIIPDSVTVIGDWAFPDCTNLTSVIIPISVTSIGKCAFCGCDKLNSINIPDAITYIGNNAFEDCNLASVFIPIGTKTRLKHLLPTNLHCILIECDFTSTKVTNEDLANSWIDEFGVKYSKDGKRLLKAPRKLKEYAVKSGTKVICDNAFCNLTPDGDCYDNSYIIDISIPTSIVAIGNGAFAGCYFKKILLPKSLKMIGKWAFAHCFSLEQLVIPNEVVSIGSYAFSYCLALKEIYLTDSLQIIGPTTFYKCGPKWEGCPFDESPSQLKIIIPNNGTQKFITKLPGLYENIIELKDAEGWMPNTWYLKEDRLFTQEEKDSVNSNTILGGNHGNICKFTLNSGENRYIPMHIESTRGQGESIDMNKAHVLVFSKKGEIDEIRIYN